MDDLPGSRELPCFTHLRIRIFPLNLLPFATHSFLCALAQRSARARIPLPATPFGTWAHRWFVLSRHTGIERAGNVAFWRSANGKELHGILLRGEQAAEITGLPGFPIVFPADLDNDDTVVGLLQAPDDMRFTRAFRWRQGKLQLLQPLDGQNTDATAINRRGEIVGGAQVASGAFHAVLWRNSAPEDLGTLGAGEYSKARDINDRGVIIGEANITPNGSPQAFIWKDGRMQQLPDLSNGTLCSAQAINDRAEVVGSCDKPGGNLHGVLWREGKTIDLGALSSEDHSVSTALDINIHSQIVGMSEISDDKQRAFLWESGKIQNLNNLIQPHSGWLLLVASRINDAGEIVGRGSYRDGIHSFLLVPQTPPGAR